VINGTGDYQSTPEREMRAYDRLPKTVRRAIGVALINYSAESILRDYRCQGARAIVTIIKTQDRNIARAAQKKAARA
jgi:hypothetical protein